MVSKVVKSVKGSEPAKSIASPAQDKNALQVEVKKGESADLTVAKKLTNPQVTAVLTMLWLAPAWQAWASRSHSSCGKDA
jgi:hypothetical protein